MNRRRSDRPVSSARRRSRTATRRGASHQRTPIDTTVPTIVGSSLPNVGAGRVSHRPRADHADRRRQRIRRSPVAARRASMPTNDAEPDHDDKRAEDQHDLVVRAELLDRPVLQRLAAPSR